jgi:hypothetical protein
VEAAPLPLPLRKRSRTVAVTEKPSSGEIADGGVTLRAYPVAKQTIYLASGISF